jgi:hypothetical protein
VPDSATSSEEIAGDTAATLMDTTQPQQASSAASQASCVKPRTQAAADLRVPRLRCAWRHDCPQAQRRKPVAPMSSDVRYLRNYRHSVGVAASP